MNKIIYKSLIFIVIMFLCTIFLFSAVKSKNIALKRQIIGTIKDLKPLNDNVIKKNNYIELIEFDKWPQHFIVVLGQAKYIDTIKIYWIKGFEPKDYTIEVSKNLFKWNKVGKYQFKDIKTKDGIITTEHKLKGRAAFFIRVIMDKAKNKTVKISEVQLFPKTKIKLSIYDTKIKNIKKHSAIVEFNTSVPSTGYLRFGDAVHHMDQNVGMEMDIFKVHKIVVGGLLQGTKYYYQPVVRDLNGKLVVGKVKFFKTRGIPLPKFEAVDTVEINKFSTILSWDMNVPGKCDIYFGTSQNNMKKYYSTDSLEKKHKIKIKKLIPETKFYYKIVVFDKFNNKAEYKGDFITKFHNIAFKKKVYGTYYYSYKRNSVFSIGYLGKVTDGKYNVKGIARSEDIRKKDQSVIIDLTKKYKLRDVNVVWRGVAYSRNFNVDIGNDLKNWVTIKKNIDARTSGKRMLSHGSYGLFLQSVNVKTGGKSARYVRIISRKGSKVGSTLPYDPDPYLQLAEVEIFKVPDYGAPKYQVKLIK